MREQIERTRWGGRRSLERFTALCIYWVNNDIQWVIRKVRWVMATPDITEISLLLAFGMVA